jgi:ubiquinone/menaquinone biosynthesis C-methylase UbiE
VNRIYKDEKITRIFEMYIGDTNLVVGCGINGELESIAKRFPDRNFIGIDLELTNSIEGTNFLMKHGNAEKMEFPDSFFDFIYCYHVLEHVQNPEIAIHEMSRVLNHKSHLFVGTPNKARIFGYFSSGEGLLTFVKWNVLDWKMRILGRWSNLQGAHAGFYSEELRNMTLKKFSQVTDLSNNYYQELYSKRLFILRILQFTRITNKIYPSLYFLAKK